MNATSDRTEWTLIGLDGANPLAFLAALGTLRTCARCWRGRNPRLAWIQARGGWRPVLSVDGDVSRPDLVAAIHATLREMDGHRAFTFAPDLKVSPGEFRGLAVQAALDAIQGDTRLADFVGAFGCETLGTEDGASIQDTAFRTMSGAGHQHFVGFMGLLAQITNAGHLDAALFENWAYADPTPAMRWDPAEDRRYALRWSEPSKDPIRTVRGANRLAVEGLPLLPVQPGASQLHTTGFRQVRRKGVSWSWPLWEAPLPVDVVRSLLALREITHDVPPSEHLRDLGIAAVYRCERITQGKYRNFTPSRPV